MINAVSNGTTQATQAKSTQPTAQLDKDQFLKLLMTQLQNQDPMNPMDEKDFMGQMAQFSTLEQVTNLAQAMTSANFGSQVSQATSLIGHEVTWENADGTSGTGVPTKVTLNGTQVQLEIGATTIAPNQISSIGGIPAAQPAATPSAASGGVQP